MLVSNFYILLKIRYLYVTNTLSVDEDYTLVGFIRTR